MPIVVGVFLARVVADADLPNGGARPEEKKMLLGSISYQEGCSGLLIPDTDLGENPRRERGV